MKNGTVSFHSILVVGHCHLLRFRVGNLEAGCACKRTKGNNMSKFHTYNSKPLDWYISSGRLPDGNYQFKVNCPRCGERVLEYEDGQRLTAKIVEHCGVKETFYVTHVTFETTTTSSPLKEQKAGEAV